MSGLNELFVSSSGKVELPRVFVNSLKILFDILDEDNDGFVPLDEIQSRWQGEGINGLPTGVLDSLGQVAPKNGFLTFELFCAALKLTLQKNKDKNGRKEEKQPNKATVKPNNVHPMRSSQSAPHILRGGIGWKSRDRPPSSNDYIKVQIDRNQSPPLKEKNNPQNMHALRNEPTKREPHRGRHSLGDKAEISAELKNWQNGQRARGITSPGSRPISRSNTRTPTSPRTQDLSPKSKIIYEDSRIYQYHSQVTQHPAEKSRSPNSKGTKTHLVHPQEPIYVKQSAPSSNNNNQRPPPPSSNNNNNQRPPPPPSNNNNNQRPPPPPSNNNNNQRSPPPPSNNNNQRPPPSSSNNNNNQRMPPTYTDKAPPTGTKKSSRNRREEPRRHTLSNGVDFNALKRLKQLEQEKDILCQGLEVIDRAQEWYRQEILNIKEKQDGLGSNAQDFVSLKHQDQIAFRSTRIQEINRQLNSLMKSKDGFPDHMNLALPTKAHQHDMRNLPLVSQLKDQNRQLTQEVSSKSEKITVLEKEKAALIRQMFDARAKQQNREKTENSIFL